MIGLLLALLLLLASPSPALADCADDCRNAYYNCLGRGNPDTCVSQQGVCLSRCTTNRERHGAIAYSVRKEVYGYSFDHDSARKASDQAVQNCRKQERGADDCTVVVTFHNACGALARGGRGAYGSAWATTGREASAKALRECRPHGGDSCKIERQVCSGAGR